MGFIFVDTVQLPIASNKNPFLYDEGTSVAYQDQETNTHYNYFRDYEPAIGRYVQSDPIGLAGGINTYTYVGSNPLGVTDPTGELGQIGRRDRRRCDQVLGQRHAVHAGVLRNPRQFEQATRTREAQVLTWLHVPRPLCNGIVVFLTKISPMAI